MRYIMQFNTNFTQFTAHPPPHVKIIPLLVRTQLQGFYSILA